MGIGINLGKDRDDDNYDGPLFGRHWLDDVEDIDDFPTENIFSKENILKSIQRLSKRDQVWIKKQMEKEQNTLTFKKKILKEYDK